MRLTRGLLQYFCAFVSFSDLCHRGAVSSSVSQNNSSGFSFSEIPRCSDLLDMLAAAAPCSRDGSLLAANGWNPCSRFLKYSSPILSSNILLLGGRGRNCEIIWGREGHRRSYLQLIAGSNHFRTGFGARLIIESTQITNQSTFFRLILHHCTFYRDSE